MAALVANAKEYLCGRLESGAKVLLVNPPVQEKRYHWIRWNQPLELLRMSTWLKTNTGAREIRLFDFMFPDGKGEVPRHKVKETWTGPHGRSLWHFGESFERFEGFLDGLLKRGWVPDVIVISSLTSYWHLSIEKLLVRICNLLGPRHRGRTTLALYGAYPRIEPEHAEALPDADVAFTGMVDTTGCAPDFELYLSEAKRLPNFFALDVYDPGVAEHLGYCLELRESVNRRRGLRSATAIDVTFFNDDIFGSRSHLKELKDSADRYATPVRIDVICGVQPSSASRASLEMLAAIGGRSLFIEYATRADGQLDENAYAPFREFLAEDLARRRAGRGCELASRDSITAFVNVGLPQDDLEMVVRNTLLLNRYFQAIILKPFGYSPDIDRAPASERRARWPTPASASPQWFPYVGHGSRLQLADYDNLMRWQAIVNRRVRNFTFDFLADGTVPRLVRETLIDESWKRHRAGIA